MGEVVAVVWQQLERGRQPHRLLFLPPSLFLIMFSVYVSYVNALTKHSSSVLPLIAK